MFAVKAYQSSVFFSIFYHKREVRSKNNLLPLASDANSFVGVSLSKSNQVSSAFLFSAGNLLAILIVTLFLTGAIRVDAQDKNQVFPSTSNNLTRESNSHLQENKLGLQNQMLSAEDEILTMYYDLYQSVQSSEKILLSVKSDTPIDPDLNFTLSPVSEESKIHPLWYWVLPQIIGALLVFFLIRKRQRVLRDEQIRQYEAEAYVLPNYQETTTDEPVLNPIFARFLRYVERQRPYLQHDYSLAQASRDVGVNERYLSSAINAGAGKNFNAFINSYRVQAAVELMEKEPQQKWNIYDLSSEVGFANRQTFFRAFKKATGKSPSEYSEWLASVKTTGK